MDLRSGCPYWLLKDGLLDSYPPLRNDETCEVVVLGGGITGALIAYELTKAGANVVLLDKRDVATGSTAASTALLQYEADTELVDLIPLVGQAQAVRSYQLGLEAIEKLEGLVSELGNDCGFARRPSLYLASRNAHLEKLRVEYAVRRRNGFHVEFLGSDEVWERYRFAAPGAILSAGDAEVDAYRLTHALLRRATTQGLKVRDRCAAISIENRANEIVIKTDRKFIVRAQRVVFATGYESHQYLKQDVGTLHSTFAFVSEPLERFPVWPDRCLIWETARPYVYVRGADEKRVIVGGEDVPAATSHRQKPLLKRKMRKLQRRFLDLFPDADLEVAYAWAGTFSQTRDGLAYIGQTKEWPGAYFALGYGGNGITMSMVASKLITDDYLGKANPDAVIFRFDR